MVLTPFKIILIIFRINIKPGPMKRTLFFMFVFFNSSMVFAQTILKGLVVDNGNQ